MNVAVALFCKGETISLQKKKKKKGFYPKSE